MENQVLSIKQMQRLKELGVDTSKASICFVRCPLSGEWVIVVKDNNMHEIVDDCIFAFTLQDILEILPKEINWMSLRINVRQSWVEYGDVVDGAMRCVNMEFGESLLESAYKMLCWVAENGYLKQKTMITKEGYEILEIKK